MSGPFHEGELEVQDRYGLRSEVHGPATRFIRDRMPEQHQEFFAALPLIVVGSISSDGQPSASMLFGRPGFLASPGPRRLVVRAERMYADPLGENLRLGVPAGLLGLDPRTRRRNRLNGRVAAISERAFELAVDQSFGNCPQYIRVRSMALDPRIDRPLVSSSITEAPWLDAEAVEQVSTADAFFIASAYVGGPGDPRRGLDVSHRGGPPGFVRVEDERSLVFPDFAGNRFFNTLGNIVKHPLVGLLFVDFDRGDLLQVDGRAKVIWEDPLLDGYRGAERFVRVEVERVRRFERVVPIQFGSPIPSRSEARIGSWSEAESAVGATTRKWRKTS